MAYSRQRQNLGGQPIASRHGVAVAGKCDLVLMLARDLPLLPGDLHVLTHQKPGRRLPEHLGVGTGERLNASCDAGVESASSDRIGDSRHGAKAGDAIR